jgi:hypothetical protein
LWLDLCGGCQARGSRSGVSPAGEDAAGRSCARA